MRRLLVLAAFAAAAGGAIAPGAASACDPNGVPGCESHCAWVAGRYRALAGSMSPGPPDWPQTGIARCP